VCSRSPPQTRVLEPQESHSGSTRRGCRVPPMEKRQSRRVSRSLAARRPPPSAPSGQEVPGQEGDDDDRRRDSDDGDGRGGYEHAGILALAGVAIRAISKSRSVKGTSAPEPAVLSSEKALPRKGRSPERPSAPCKTNWPRAPERRDADQARVLCCGGCPGAALAVYAAARPFPGES
jgi:hypothetical protein